MDPLAQAPQDILPPVKEVKDGKFYFQSQLLFLTYKTHLNKVDLEKKLAEACARRDGTPRKFKFFRAAHEVGNATGLEYHHTHVLIDFGERYQTTKVRIFDIPSGKEILHPQWRNVTKGKYWENCVRYIAKEDPENADLRNFKALSYAENVWSCESKHDALIKFAESPAAVLGVSALYAQRPGGEVEYDGPEPDYPWQIKVRGFLSKKPDRSSVYWIYDPHGQNGKSTLCEFLECNGEANVSSLNGGAIGMAHIVKNTFDTGKLTNAWIFDLTRSFNDRDVYDFIEQMKNGKITSPKYDGGIFRFPKPHIVVMANFLPKIASLSLDRWRIFQIYKKDLYRLNTFKLLQHSNYVGYNNPKGFPKGMLDVLENPEDLSADPPAEPPYEGPSTDPSGETCETGGLTLKVAAISQTPPSNIFDYDDIVAELM